MGQFNAPNVTEGMGLEELKSLVARLIKEVQYLMDGNIDSRNTREIGGYIVGLKELKSRNGMVGLSSAISGGNDVRIWAGSDVPETAPWRVYEDGSFVSTYGKIANWDIDEFKLSGPGIIEGGIIRTGAPYTNRIELANGRFAGVTDQNKLHGLVFDVTQTEWAQNASMYFYHNDNVILTFQDGYTFTRIHGPANGPMILTPSMILGKAGTKTAAEGEWDFSSATVTGLETLIAGQHNHGIPNGTALMAFDGSAITFVESGGHTHTIE